jgi:ribosomal protein S27E
MAGPFDGKNPDIVESGDTLQGKCPSCGGILVYSPEREMLHCDYCGTDIALDLTPADVRENDFMEWLQHPEMMQKEGTVVAEVSCGQCGARTTFPENTTSYACAFCGTPVVLNKSVQRRAWKPEYLLPFKTGKKTCGELFRKWASSRWFAPSGFARQLTAEERMKGVYLPYWTYDADTLTFYSGQRGINRHVNRMVNGKSVTRTVTDWYPVSGRLKHQFDDVTVPASDSIPPDMASVLTNWDRKNYVVYNEQFVKGFLTELYKKDFRECYGSAKKQMESYISAAVRSEIGGSQQRIHTQETSYTGIKFKLVLLPVWLSAYRYKGKSWLFAVNGRTGQVAGQRPWSIPKIAALVIVIAAILLYLFANVGVL